MASTSTFVSHSPSSTCPNARNGERARRVSFSRETSSARSAARSPAARLARDSAAARASTQNDTDSTTTVESHRAPAWSVAPALITSAGACGPDRARGVRVFDSSASSSSREAVPRRPEARPQKSRQHASRVPRLSTRSERATRRFQSASIGTKTARGSGVRRRDRHRAH